MENLDFVLPRGSLGFEVRFNESSFLVSFHRGREINNSKVHNWPRRHACELLSSRFHRARKMETELTVFQLGKTLARLKGNETIARKSLVTLGLASRFHQWVELQFHLTSDLSLSFSTVVFFTSTAILSFYSCLFSPALRFSSTFFISFSFTRTERWCLSLSYHCFSHKLAEYYFRGFLASD